MKKAIRLVHVIWADSSSPMDSSWHSYPAAMPEVLKCESIGWLVAETKSALLIAGHVSHGAADGSVNQFSGEMTIPKSAVVRLRKIKDF